MLGGLVAAATLVAAPLRAQEFWESTYLVNLYLGSSLTETVDLLAVGGFELSDGTPVGFSPFYERQYTDIHVNMVTQLSSDFGVTWGVSTGESGEKYIIYPGLEFGLIWQVFQNGNSNLTLSASTALFGNLVELPCVADYGEIGGEQKVNCRMAASSLPPKDTLQYLVREPSPYSGLVSLTYSIRF